MSTTGGSCNHVSGGDRPMSTDPRVWSAPKKKATGLDWDSMRPAGPVRKLCSNCHAEGFRLSDRDLCDGCEDQLLRFNSAPPAMEPHNQPQKEPTMSLATAVDLADLLRDTENHSDPLVRATRKSVVQAALALNLALAKSSVSATNAATILSKVVSTIPVPPGLLAKLEDRDQDTSKPIPLPRQSAILLHELGVITTDVRRWAQSVGLKHRSHGFIELSVVQAYADAVGAKV